MSHEWNDPLDPAPTALSDIDNEQRCSTDFWEEHLSKISLEFEMAGESIQIEKICREVEFALESSKKKKIVFLHKYNAVKDSTQLLIGSLACLQCVTSKQIHKNLQLA